MNHPVPLYELSRRAFLLLSEYDQAIAELEAHPRGTAAEFDAALRQMRADRASIEAEWKREQATYSQEQTLENRETT